MFGSNRFFFLEYSSKPNRTDLYFESYSFLPQNRFKPHRKHPNYTHEMN